MAEKVNENRPSPNRPDRVDRGGRILTPQKTPEKSPFQKLLDETTQQKDFSADQQPGQPTATETKEAVKPVLSQQERYGRDKDQFEKRLKEKESDRDDAKTGGAKEAGTPRAKEAEKRVIARSSVGEQKHQGEGEGGGGHGGGTAGQGKKGKGFALGTESKGIRRGELGEAKPGGFVLEAPAEGSMAAAVLKAKTPAVLTKALLDQLVQYCRLVTKTDGDKEFDIQLHEEVFKGLRLRIAMVKGKVEATFVTQSRETRDLFQAQKSEIREALAQKGIDVQTINVIMV